MNRIWQAWRQGSPHSGSAGRGDRSANWPAGCVRSRNGSAGVTIDEGPGSTSAATGLVAIRLQVLFRDEAVSLRAVDDRRTRLTGLPTLAELQQVFRMDPEDSMAVARRSRHRRLARSAVSSRQVKTLEHGEEPKAPRFRSGARSSSPPLKRKGDVTRFSYFSELTGGCSPRDISATITTTFNTSQLPKKILKANMEFLL